MIKNQHLKIINTIKKIFTWQKLALLPYICLHWSSAVKNCPGNKLSVVELKLLVFGTFIRQEACWETALYTLYIINYI